MNDRGLYVAVFCLGVGMGVLLTEIFYSWKT